MAELVAGRIRLATSGAAQLQASAALLRAGGDRLLLGYVLNQLGFDLWLSGDLDRATGVLDESLIRSREDGDAITRAGALRNVGVVARLLNIDLAEIEKAIRKQFARKVKAADLNFNAARAGYDAYGLPSVLQTLQGMNAADSALALMFKTHPAPGERLDALGKRMQPTLDAYADQAQLQSRFIAETKASR